MKTWELIYSCENAHPAMPQIDGKLKSISPSVTIKVIAMAMIPKKGIEIMNER